MPTTMKDIARHLGISASTVSRALNNTGYVSQELRIQIEQAVIDLEYQPNLLARSLRTQFTHMVGLIIPDLNNPHYTGVAQAVESLLAAHDYRLILSVSNEEPASELTYLQAMQKQRVAGIVISSAGGNDEYVGHLIRQGIPVIAHARAVKAKGVDSVSLAMETVLYGNHLMHGNAIGCVGQAEYRSGIRDFSMKIRIVCTFKAPCTTGPKQRPAPLHLDFCVRGSGDLA